MRFVTSSPTQHTPPLGIIALICAPMNDVTAWCILALVVAVARAKSITSVGLSIVLVDEHARAGRVDRLEHRLRSGDSFSAHLCHVGGDGFGYDLYDRPAAYFQRLFARPKIAACLFGLIPTTRFFNTPNAPPCPSESTKLSLDINNRWPPPCYWLHSVETLL